MSSLSTNNSGVEEVHKMQQMRKVQRKALEMARQQFPQEEWERMFAPYSDVSVGELGTELLEGAIMHSQAEFEKLCLSHSLNAKLLELEAIVARDEERQRQMAERLEKERDMEPLEPRDLVRIASMKVKQKEMQWLLQEVEGLEKQNNELDALCRELDEEVGRELEHVVTRHSELSAAVDSLGSLG